MRTLLGLSAAWMVTVGGALAHEPPTPLAAPSGFAGHSVAGTHDAAATTALRQFVDDSARRPTRELTLLAQVGAGGENSAEPQANAEHPLMEGLRRNYRAREVLANVRDYTCVFIKRERIKNQLQGSETLAMKVRREPFSVYLRYLKPDDKAGTEAIFVRGQNDNKVVAHSVGLQRFAGTLRLDPTSDWAMSGNRYPVTEAGLHNLVDRMIGISEAEIRYGEVDVKTFPARIDGRDCTCVQVFHPYRRDSFKYHVARSYYDNEWQIPVRNEVYDWPARPGDQPVLLGEYTYTQLRFNVGLTDRDFDPKNPAYDYR